MSEFTETIKEAKDLVKQLQHHGYNDVSEEIEEINILLNNDTSQINIKTKDDSNES